MNGIKNEIILKSMKRVMEKNNIEVLFITETLGTEDREKEIRKVFKEYDVMYRGRKRLKGKKYAGRGGILCIAKKGTVKVESPSKEDDVMYVTWNDTYVACAYLVPPSSPYESRNEKKIEEIQQRLLARDRALLLIDANAWIGTLASSVAKVGDGMEDEVTYERKSEKIETNKQGEIFVESMNSINMVILNGIKSIAQYTYDHPGREARSVIDYIVTSNYMFDQVSDITYVDCRERLETDHKLLYVDVTALQPTHCKTKNH